MSKPLAELSLSQLRCFVAVVDAGSFAEASRRLGMSTSAVSKTIVRFESAYGLKLLHRSTHALSLTEDGEQLIDAAREMIRSATALETSIDDLVSNAGIGRVRMTTPVGLMRQCVAPLLCKFIAVHPDIHLDLRASNEIVDLAQAGIDLAIRSGSLEGIPGHLAQPWFKFPWVACASPSYIAKRGCPESPESLSSHDLIGFRNTKTGAVRPWRFRISGIINVNDQVQLRPLFQPRIVIDDGDAAWRAALNGAGIAMAPLWLAADALIAGQMIEVLRDWRGEDTQFSIVRRDRQQASKRVEAVIDFLKANTPRFSDDLLKI
jgi:DNA-binding transcriptional LysR family regulator